MTGVVIALAVVGTAVGYWGACAFWPYAACRSCKGGGRKRSPSKRYWRPCRRCKGSGTRVRTGRRMWNWLAGQRDAAR
jgi:DnaJ-class molecular chaperone